MSGPTPRDPPGPAEDAAAAGRGRPESWLNGLLVLGLAAAFLVAVRPVLSPVALYALLLYVLWPGLSAPLYRRLAVAVTVLFVLWVMEVTGLLLAPFLLALILAYILDPVVDFLEERGLARSAGVALLALPVLGLLALFVFVVGPAVIHQLSQFVADVPDILGSAARLVEELRAWVIGLGIPGVTEATLPRPRGIDAAAIVDYVRERRAAVAEQGLQAVLGIGRGLGAVLTLLAYLVLLPVLTFYLLRDWDGIRARAEALLPRAHADGAVAFAARFDELLSGYLRGQLVLAAVVGLIIFLGFTLVGFPYALLLGLLAAVFNIVPYLGLALSLLAALVVALFSGAIVASLLKVAAVYAVEQVLEGALGPKIVGESVGLHPVWVILALALFSFFLGFVGLLIAVPAAVFLKLLIEAAHRRYRASAFYGAARSTPRSEGPPVPRA